jgi:DNA repair exonuclease SbcCD ATPase subunit
MSARLDRRSEAILRVRVAVDDQGLRSGAASVEALARALIEHLRSKVADLAAREQGRQRERIEVQVKSVETALARTESRLRDIEKEWGDPVAERELVRDRQRDARAAFSEAAIDAAVLRRQLERAKAAAARAVEVERLQRQADEVAAEVDRAEAGEREGLRRKLRELERVLDEARAKSPSLGSARERVFDLEVDLTAAEGRAELLERELGELRQRAGDLLRAEREYRDLLQDREARLARRRAVHERRDDLLPRLAEPTFELLGRPAPDPETPR